jgi:hypothetical protein
MKQLQRSSATAQSPLPSSRPPAGRPAAVRQPPGNRSVLRWLQSGVVQAKLVSADGIGSAGVDAHEREAEQAAARVAQGLLPRVTMPLPRGGAAPPLAAAGLPGLGMGRPLASAIRRRFEDLFGWDFGAVRLHTGRAAAAAAGGVGARAFTTGSHIVFGGTVDNPEGGSHRRLLAHELAHVVQQAKGAGAARPSPRAGESGGPAPLAVALTAAPAGKTQADPLVTAVAGPDELGVGRQVRLTATVAPRAGNLTWRFIGVAPPAGVAIAPSGRNATIRSAAAPNPHPAAGTRFTVRAERATAAGDGSDHEMTLVGFTALTFNAAPPFLPTITGAPAAGATAPPPQSADPNRDGVAGNAAPATVTSAPAARPAGTTLTLPTALGATVAGLLVTPGTRTGTIRARITDNATGTFLNANLSVNPVPLRVNRFPAQAAVPAPNGPYGAVNTTGWAASDTAGALNRIIGETITAGARDDFGLTATINGTGPNPAPMLRLSAPANNWNDWLTSSARATAAGGVAPAGVAGDDTCVINVNRFVGPGVAAPLPRLWILRQGFRWLGWTGVPAWSTEFDHGIHRRSLVRTGPNAFGFRTEQIFPAARAPLLPQPYIGPPLVALSAITLNTTAAPAAPLANGGLAADGTALGGVTVTVAATATGAAGATVVGRTVNWSVPAAGIAFSAPATGVVGAANTAAGTVQAGLAAGNFRVRAADAVFANRRVDGRVRVVPVRLRNMRAPVRTVPAGTMTADVNVSADPGGRNLDWAVDPAAFAANVRVVGNAVAAAAVAAPARTATVTRPPGFTGRVTVTASDHIVPTARASITITFR